MIHGMHAVYNDITPWKHTQLLDVFGANPAKSRNYQVTTKTELEQLFHNKEFCDAGVIQLVELFMPKEDSPRALTRVAEITAARNAA